MFPLLNIARHRLGIDGQGVTTLVAGASCPLHCAYCINKEILNKGKVIPVSAQELYDKVKIDDLYYKATGGGITFGGGESLLHADFYSDFRSVCSDNWNLSVETSLAVPKNLVELAIQSIDDFIVDCKDMHPDIYNQYTGGNFELMYENLCFLLDSIGPDRIVVRVPLIPNYNTTDIQKDSVEKLKALGVTRFDVFNYVIK
jgi:pyruvate formate lyase activating enzyme